jgi:predicted DNA-binding transcriptional regulator YafY
MNRIDRLMGILTFLQTKKFVQANAIAERFDISVRTVYRDIKALVEQGIPVSFEQTRGYFIVQGYFLPPVSFTNEEANALLLVEALVSGFADKSIKDHYASALNKVKAILRSSQKDNVERMHQHIMLQIPQRMRNDLEYLSVIQESITSRTVIQVKYKNNKEETSDRQLEPIGLIFYAFSWHLIGWCHLRGDYRDFKVDRILEIKKTSTPFCKADHISMNEYSKYLPVDY